MEKATFKLDSYQFTKASFDFNIPNKAELSISFNPSGKFIQETSSYELDFEVLVECGDNVVISLFCEAFFSFNENLTIEDIPDYFYPNSLAILFPYVRAFVGTLSLQANVHPVMLPTINLMGLTEELKRQTIVIK